MLKRQNTQKGFTLVELLVAVSIFVVVVTMAMGSIVVIFQSNNQAASIRLALDNANFALNSMSREMRLGRGFTCGNAVCDGDSDITFTAFGDEITYRLAADNSIEKQADAGEPWLPLTTDRYQIDALNFTQSGTDPDFVTIYVSGTVTNGDQSTNFDLQTGVSSR